MRVAGGLERAGERVAPRNEKNNVYVVEKPGRIRVIVGGRLRARPFLNITRLVTNGGEQGLLSVAFTRATRANHRFYVDYTDRNGDARIVEYRARGLARSPVKVRQIFFQRDPYENHNGGQLAFGPDGYLYAGRATAAPAATRRTVPRICARRSASCCASTSKKRTRRR